MTIKQLEKWCKKNYEKLSNGCEFCRHRYECSFLKQIRRKNELEFQNGTKTKEQADKDIEKEFNRVMRGFEL